MNLFQFTQIRVHWISWMFYINILYQIWEVFSCYFFQRGFQSFPPDMPTMGILISLNMSHIYLESVHFSLFLSISQTCSFLCHIFKFINPFACSNLPLKPCSDFFFHFSYGIFSARISFWSLFMYSISLLIVQFCSYVTFLTFFMSSFSSLSIFNSACLKIFFL